MRFLLDANIPFSAKTIFAETNYQVEHVRDVHLQHASDEDIMAYAKSIEAVVVSRDLDFANILRFPPQHYCGVIVLRLDQFASAQDIKVTLSNFISGIQSIQLKGCVLILEKNRWRLRRAGADSRSLQ